MRIIHVLRKPLSEGTVASNVLKHGTGGINIDASRVGTEQIPINRLEVWSGFGRKERPAYVATTGEGRWPANVILQHLDGCRCDGVKMANWICEPGCPVPRLDEQSGERKTTWIAPSHKNNRDGDFMGALNHPGHQGYNDTGGASRFYKQVGGSKVPE